MLPEISISPEYMTSLAHKVLDDPSAAGRRVALRKIDGRA